MKAFSASAAKFADIGNLTHKNVPDPQQNWQKGIHHSTLIPNQSLHPNICFREVSEILIMVPALLGLKGNLEMTLASRLSTAANMGHLDRWERKLIL